MGLSRPRKREESCSSLSSKPNSTSCKTGQSSCIPGSSAASTAVEIAFSLQQMGLPRPHITNTRTGDREIQLFSQFQTQLDILEDWAEVLHPWLVCRIDGGVKAVLRDVVYCILTPFTITRLNSYALDDLPIWLLVLKKGSPKVPLRRDDDGVSETSRFSRSNRSELRNSSPANLAAGSANGGCRMCHSEELMMESLKLRNHWVRLVRATPARTSWINANASCA